MSIRLLCQAFYFFFVVVEIILMVYVLSYWLPIPRAFRQTFVSLMLPILVPIRLLMKKSIFFSPHVDLSPVVALAVVAFLQEFFYNLANY